ncbi:G-type lectin S-receptor-like serine/threonine-protein kinase At2g19130 isoform X2 [Tasmannia lanceolata]|uniref:G-type lectin S-receptor-like serine/threonine-protein kinase At2g19130 isoform X2 n=1 Tax=Tasmannia lanceolata TaxID=3420 RepID=UPI004062DB18
MEIKSRSWIFIPLYLFLFKTHFSMAANSISRVQSLSGNQTITSQGGKFELGFFTPGRIMKFTWSESIQDWNSTWVQPIDNCEVLSPCGAFGICSNVSSPPCICLRGFVPGFPKDWNLSAQAGGCVRRTSLQCSNSSSTSGEEDGFFLMSNMRNADNYSTVVGNAKECRLACLRDCSCSAYAYVSQCSIWKGDLNNLQQLINGQGIDLYLRLAGSELLATSIKKGTIIWYIVGAVIVVVLGLVLVLVWKCRRRLIIRSSETLEGFLVMFSYKDLKKATYNFSEKLGAGSFGSVYKGTLPNSNTIAVKKLEGFRQGEKQFRMEVSTIGLIQHVNLVPLRGFCAEGSERLLVYDYMPNGSLACNLFHKNSEILDWKIRYQIALGTARGLAYLHEECRDCIIHCDIKPENVLLDAEFCPKVSDFGMSKLIGRDCSRVLTTMRGTLGYLAPEWASGTPITTKADVYSYGMMFFEIISGRRNTKRSEDGTVDFFPIVAASKTFEGEAFCLLDERLEGKADMEELERACRVACWCIQEDESCRPSMGEVIQALEGVLEVKVLQVPTSLRRLAQDYESTVYSDSSSDESSTYLMVNASV